MSAPLAARAGVFSYVLGLFEGESEETRALTLTSQNAAILAAAQNPDPNPAKGGGDITVIGGVALLPETGPEGTLADIAENQSGAISLYVVREGDTLSGIAKMFGVSINTIAWANDIRNAVIRPGQTLVILPISGVRHVVAKGDTLALIARKYKADLHEILQYNGLAENAALSQGDVVLVPDGELAPVTLAMPGRVRGTGGPNYEGYYLRPVISGRKTQGLHGYNGVDIASYLGAPILASAAGEVLIARDYGWNGGYGKYLVIAHPNGTQTLYGHLSSLLAYAGKRVVRGEIVGYMGASGRATGVHLHFEVRGARNSF
ncbi:MAG: M23 family metallopeptidase [Patescibacteria group bacterium]